MDTETNNEMDDSQLMGCIQWLASDKPDMPDLDDAGMKRLELLLAEELTEYDLEQFDLDKIRLKIERGESISHSEAVRGLNIALNEIENVKAVNRMFLAELNKQDKENQRLRQQPRAFISFDEPGNA